MSPKRSLVTIINRLINRALEQGCCSGDGQHMERIKNYKGYANLPDRYKPGRMIMDLNEKDRKVLKTATDKDFNHRTL